MSRPRTLGILVGALTLVTACGQPVDRTPPEPGGLPSPTPVKAEPSVLAAQRANAGLPDCPTTAAPAAPGLPGVTLSCIDGSSSVPLNQLVKGTTVINFWAQWCGPCREEAPHLAEVSKQAKDATFIGVDQDDPDPQRAIAFAGAAGWTYPQLADPEALTRKPPLQVTGLPVTLVVSGEGKVVARHVGPLKSAAELRALMAKAEQ